MNSFRLSPIVSLGTKTGFKIIITAWSHLDPVLLFWLCYSIHWSVTMGKVLPTEFIQKDLKFHISEHINASLSVRIDDFID